MESRCASHGAQMLLRAGASNSDMRQDCSKAVQFCVRTYVQANMMSSNRSACLPLEGMNPVE